MAYLSLAQVRALPNLSDTAKFTDAALTAAVSWFEAVFEDYTGLAFETRTVNDERHYVMSAGFIELDHLYPRAVSAVRSYSSASVSVPYTAAELADLEVAPSGVLRRVGGSSFSSSYGIVAVDYTHGKTATPPADVVEAAKTAVRAHLIDDYQANRQFAVSTEAGIIRTSQPGPDTPFGLQQVDEVANRRREKVPGLA